MANGKFSRHEATNLPFQKRGCPDWTDLPEMSDVVEEAAADSFPASDPPAWTPLTVGPPLRGIPARAGDCFSYTWPQTPDEPDQTHPAGGDLADILCQLETVLARVVPVQEEWRDQVLHQLREVRETLSRHEVTDEVPEHFLADLDLTGPGQVRQGIKLGIEHDELRVQARMLLILSEIEVENRTSLFRHIRRRIAGLLKALRDHQARETDLVLESLCTDIGTGD